MSMQRQLQSITVTPSSADASKFPSGQVQFAATGNFNMAPMTAATPVTWSIQPMMGSMMMGSMMPTGVSINAMTGMAQCSGFMGTVTIMATSPTSGMSQMGGTMTTNVTGTALLTCP